MASDWHQAYMDLNEYVTSNPQIALGDEIIEIPEHFKTEFYTRFNSIRSQFIEEHFPYMIDQAGQMSGSLRHAEMELVSRLGLEEIELPPTLRWYVKDPIDALRRVLYDSLFDLLRDKITVNTFETAGIRAIKDLDNRLRQRAYQFWIAFSLANLLEPETLHTVDVHIASSTLSHAEAMNPNEQPVKRPVQATRLSIRQEDFIFTAPDMILNSTRFNKYFAIRIEPISANWTATNATEKAEWIPIDINIPFLPGMIIMNIGDTPWDLALVADASKLRRPDVLIMSEGLEGWHEGDWSDELQIASEIMHPLAGTFVISRQQLSEDATDKENLQYQKLLSELASGEGEKQRTDSLHILSAELDKNKLEPVIDAITSTKKP
jgi:hypothetical protein